MDLIHAMSTPHLHAARVRESDTRQREHLRVALAMREPLLRRASRRLRRPGLRAHQPTTATAAAEIC